MSLVYPAPDASDDVLVACEAIAAQPLDVFTYDAIRKALQPLGYEVYNHPALPKNDRGVSPGKIAASAVRGATSIGFEIDPTPKLVNLLQLFPGRAKVIVRRESADTEPPEGVDALVVRKPLPKPTTPIGAAAGGPYQGKRVFVAEGTPEWQAWMEWWDTPASATRYPGRMKPSADMTRHEGKRGWWFDSAYPP
jgi:hypothetical protein